MDTLPNIAALRINNSGSDPELCGARYIEKLKTYAKSLPYSIEPYSEMMDLLDFILMRITQCVEAKDFEPGLLQWDSMLNYWAMLKYPIPKDKRIKLARLYFHLATTPGMPLQRIAGCADIFQLLTRSKKKTSIDDLRLPWRPIYDILSEDLFLKRRQFEYTQLSWCMGYMADNSRRFFHPAAIDDMLTTFVPQINMANLDSILASQYFLVTFLPLTHPQSYLPMLFRTWEAVNSYMYDERMLHFLSKLAEMHVDKDVSDPTQILKIPDDARSPGESRPGWSETQEDHRDYETWDGLYKDVGIFTVHEWGLIMCKCLASMQIPLADAGSVSTSPHADVQVGFELNRLPKPNWRISSLAHIIVYSMASDGIPYPESSVPTPLMTPTPSGMNTPHVQTSTLKDYLSAPLGKHFHRHKGQTYLAGSKALDSLARLIASTESFFHPSNSGAWTSDLSAFIKYVVYDFNKRWHEEEKDDCKTPLNRRLTRNMKRELVKSLRTVALLAMFSQDSNTVTNIQSTLKSMSVMEPDLILYPILERAAPSLEALVETERTMSMIKALGSIAPAIVSREIYYPGAKHLVPILDLLIPGIDLNDPSKTLCTTAFLVEISQYIMFGDLTAGDYQPTLTDSEAIIPDTAPFIIPAPVLDGEVFDLEPRLSDEEEDILLQDTTAGFADWVANFIRRVIQLMENLPEEGPDGGTGGSATIEVQVVDAVAKACNQICVHLSEPLYDLVLNMVYDYASTNVRSNAVRAIHQLVECVANANPTKTLRKFFPFCSRNIRIELENGASSTRTTSASSPMPSDATLHWSLAILRGTVYNDGNAMLAYKEELLSLLKLLHSKCYSKRGFSWTGKLLSSTLLTLSHTYPLENKFVNPDEWDSQEFKKNHHRYWGKLYKPGEITMSWHVPNEAEIDFTIQIFKELVEPAITLLEGLLDLKIPRDSTWRNDFCRHLTIVRNAFAGVPTLAKEYMTDTDISAQKQTSDIINEIPEMIATLPSINSGFCLTDQDDSRYQYMRALRHRFGLFLHDASLTLHKQGEENTVDAVEMLIRSMRTYMLDYGDSRDSYWVNDNLYNSEMNVARQFGGQKVWPRSVYVRRARYYHSARLHWNSTDRIRGPLEDYLIDDLVQWATWHYATIRELSQNLIDSIIGFYDGIRIRILPKLYAMLESGTDNDRMKGALWTLSLNSMGKFAVSDPTLAPEIITGLLKCQHNEKHSIQECVAKITDNCLGSFLEPCYLVYEVPSKELDDACRRLKILLPQDYNNVVEKCRQMRIERLARNNASADSITSSLLTAIKSTSIHWKYEIVVIRCFRTLIRRDVPLNPEHLQVLMEKTYATQPTVRYYAQRAVMKALSNIKLRSYCSTTWNLTVGHSLNPLKTEVPVQPSTLFVQKFLQSFRVPIVLSQPGSNIFFFDKERRGLMPWKDTLTVCKPPDQKISTFCWEKASQPAVTIVRSLALSAKFWKKLEVYFSEENNKNYVAQDNISCVKSIFQVLEDEPFEILRPIIERLIKDKEKDKQRAAAEILAGIINGSKHWPLEKQENLWKWFEPLLPVIFRTNIKTDTLSIWTSFLEYVFSHKDPRRLQPLMDFILNEFKTVDCNAELSFDAWKVFSLFKSIYVEIGGRFSAWCDEAIARCWPELYSDHDDVRAYIADLLAFTDRIKRQPRPSIPTTEAFVRECRILPEDFDIMGMRGVYHKERISELVQQFKVWKVERVPGVRASKSKYDRVGITLCKFLFQIVHDIHAIGIFDYILPLMPEIFRFTELNDNDDLANRASVLLVRMCGVIPPQSLVNPILESIFETIQSAPSWRVRLKALPLVQVFYFRNVPLIPEYKVIEILEVLCKCLDDEVVEVREMAATTLSGILRLSPRPSILTYKARFVKLAQNSYIPSRHDPQYNKAIRKRHAAILGICALVDSYPYTIEKWMPDLLTKVLAEHTYDPVPISTTIRDCARNFKKTHQDTWHEDSKKFNEDQLATLSTLLTGSTYYA